MIAMRDNGKHMRTVGTAECRSLICLQYHFFFAALNSDDFTNTKLTNDYNHVSNYTYSEKILYIVLPKSK